MNATPSEIETAAALLRAGELVAFPTETVYGLGGDATNDLAVARIYDLKGRPSFNPLIVHVPDLAAAEALADFGPEARALAEAFWPGPLTLVLPRAKACPASLLVSAGLPSIAIRVPAHPLAQKLLHAVKRPIAAPSANPSGKLSPTLASHVRDSFGEKLPCVLDGGPAAVGLESTIVGLLEDEPRLLRAGGLPRDEIERVLKRPLIAKQDAARPASPGQLESHYAPRARLRLAAGAPREGEAWLGFGSSAVHGRNLSPSGDLTEAAANLFRLLHEIDAEGPAAIAVAAIPDAGLGEAINDRLRRAAAPRP